MGPHIGLALVSCLSATDQAPCRAFCFRNKTASFMWEMRLYSMRLGYRRLIWRGGVLVHFSCNYVEHH